MFSFRSRRLLFCERNSYSNSKNTKDDIINMVEFLVDTMFVVIGGMFFQQIVGISMITNCAPLLTNTFLFSYEAELIQYFLSVKKKQWESRFEQLHILIIQTLRIIVVRCIPPSLRSKTIRRATPLLPTCTWINSCRLEGRTTVHVPFRQMWPFQLPI